MDNWAAGCIFAELMLRLPYMAGETDFDQLNVIFRALGTPSEEEWPVSGGVRCFREASASDVRTLGGSVR